MVLCTLPGFPFSAAGYALLEEGGVRVDPLKAEESVQRRAGHWAPEILPGSPQGVVEALIGLPCAF